MSVIAHSHARTIFLSAVCLSAVAPQSFGGVQTATFGPSGNRNGSVRIFMTDLSGNSVSATVNIPANTNANQKRTLIQNAIVAAGLPAGWTVAGNMNNLTVTNNNANTLITNFYPRNTGERQDRLFVPGNQGPQFRGGHGNMDPHAPSGMSLMDANGAPAIFDAGITVGNTDYVYTLMGNDPLFGGASTISDMSLTNMLYSGLAAMNLPAGVTLTNSGASGIDVNFSSSLAQASGVGIVWGSTSVTGDIDDTGYNASMVAVPEPGTLALLGGGLLLALRRRSQRD